MTPGQYLRERVELALKSAGAQPAIHAALAADYADACRKLNARLDQLREVLDAGDERQALLMAEVYPSVLDEAESLAFVKSAAWRKFCQENQLTPAPEIKASVIQRLNGIYAKGITSSHAIYKEFRAAVLARKDEESMVLARAIEKLAPADEHARSERERIENKVFAKKVADLADALKDGDPVEVLSGLEAVEALGMAEREAGSREVREAVAVRKSVDATSAHESVVGYLAKLAIEEERGDWQEAGVLISRCDALVDEHHLTLTPDETAKLARRRAFFTRQQGAAIQQQNFQDAVKSLLKQAETVESRTQARGTAPLGELRDMLTNLSKRWQTVEGFQLPVDDTVVQKVGKLVTLLRTEISRLQKKRLITVSALILVVATLTSAVGWYFLNRHRAGELAAQLDAEVQARNVTSVARLLETAESSGLGGFSAKLVAATASAKAFHQEMDGAAASMEKLVSEFEAELSSADLSQKDPGELHATSEQITSRLSELPAEMQVPFRPRIEAIRQSLGAQILSASTQARDALSKRLEEFTADLMPRMSARQSLSEFREAVEVCEAEVAAWTTLTRTDVPGFAIPSDLAARAEAEKGKVTRFREQLDLAAGTITAMNNAKDPESYRAALASFGTIDLPFVSDVLQARLAHPLETNSDALYSRLMFPWNPPTWFTLKGKERSLPLHPKELLPSEDKLYDVLFNDANSKAVYQAEINGKPPRIVYTRDRPLGKSDMGDGVVFYSGDVFDPEYDGSQIAFHKALFKKFSDETRYQANKASSDPRLSNFSQTYNAMQLEGFYLEDGTVTCSLLEVLDRANASENPNLAYLAFVSRQVEAIVNQRPSDWGLPFSPSAIKRFQDLREALGSETISSGLWMIPSKSKSIEDRVASVFKEPTYFLKEAELIRSLSRACLDTPMKFAGYIGADGKPVLWDPLVNADSLFGFTGTPDDPEIKRVFVRKTDGETPTYEATGVPIAFSPLFRFDGDRREVFDKARRSAGLQLPIPGQITIPPLFSDLNSESP